MRVARERVVEHARVGEAVAEGEHGLHADLAHDRGHLVHLQVLDDALPAHHERVVLTVRVGEAVASVLPARDDRAVGPDEPVRRQVDHGRHHLAQEQTVRPAAHVHAEILRHQQLHHLQHRLVVRRAALQSREAGLRLLHERAHVGGELVEGHPLVDLHDQPFAVGREARDGRARARGDGGLALLARGFVGRIVQHAVLEQQPVEVGGIGFAEERAVEVEHGHARRRGDVVGRSCVRHGLHVLQQRLLRRRFVAPERQLRRRRASGDNQKQDNATRNCGNSSCAFQETSVSILFHVKHSISKPAPPPAIRPDRFLPYCDLHLVAGRPTPEPDGLAGIGHFEKRVCRYLRHAAYYTIFPRRKLQNRSDLFCNFPGVPKPAKQV